MNRDDLERLTKAELVEAYLALQAQLWRPAKTSRTSSKPQSSDKKERRERSNPGGAKPGHKGHARRLADNPDAVIDHRPETCTGCGQPFADDAAGDMLGELGAAIEGDRAPGGFLLGLEYIRHRLGCGLGLFIGQ